MQIAEVGADAGNSSNTALMVHNVVDILRLIAVKFRDKRDDRGIDASATRSHHDALERRQSHRSVDALSAFDGGERGTVSKMARDETMLFSLALSQFSRTARDKCVRRPVKTVTPNAVVFVVTVRESVHVRFRRHRLMESRIKYTDLRDAGHQLLADFDAGQVSRVVERTPRIAFADGIFARLRHLCGFRKIWPSMDNAMTDRRDLIETLNDGCFRIE
jgi:hypothetical protein